MSRLYQILWVLITISIALSLPNHKVAREQQVFSITTTKLSERTPLGRQSLKVENGQQRPMWRNTTSQLFRRNPDAISLHVDPDHQFAWTPIQLGVQRLGVMLDIGSTQFWVFASQNDSVQPSGLLSYTQLYVPGNSASWQSMPNASFASSYMAGFTATGIVGTDSLTVGQLPPVRQHVGVMWYENPVMDPQQIQGILGLGLSSDRSSGTMGMPTFLDLLLPKMQSPMFTIAIDKWGTGTWDFGHINSTKYIGSLQSVPVDDSCGSGGSWKVTNIAAQFLDGPIPQAMCGFFDTGYDFMNLDPAIVARYYRDIPGANMDTVQGQYTFPCDSNMPDLNLVIGGVGIKIHGRVLNYHPFDAQANICMGALQNSWDGGAVFGQVFYMAQFMVFDVGGRTMSFAEIRQDL